VVVVFCSYVTVNANEILYMFFADRIATHSVIGCFHATVWPSLCDAVHCDTRGRCSGLKVVPSCS